VEPVAVAAIAFAVIVNNGRLPVHQ